MIALEENDQLLAVDAVVKSKYIQILLSIVCYQH